MSTMQIFNIDELNKFSIKKIEIKSKGGSKTTIIDPKKLAKMGVKEIKYVPNDGTKKPKPKIIDPSLLPEMGIHQVTYKTLPRTGSKKKSTKKTTAQKDCESAPRDLDVDDIYFIKVQSEDEWRVEDHKKLTDKQLAKKDCKKAPHGQDVDDIDISSPSVKVIVEVDGQANVTLPNNHVDFKVATIKTKACTNLLKKGVNVELAKMKLFYKGKVMKGTLADCGVKEGETVTVKLTKSSPSVKLIVEVDGHGKVTLPNNNVQFKVATIKTKLFTELAKKGVNVDLGKMKLKYKGKVMKGTLADCGIKEGETVTIKLA